MAIKITEQMLISIAAGSAPFTRDSVRRARAFLAAAGVTEPVELHPLEVDQIRTLRRERAMLDAQIAALVALGPAPVCTCTLNEYGIVESSSGCPLGCNVGEQPFEVAP